MHLVEESVLESLKVKADFHNFKPRPFNMREFYERTGHDINEMLLSCHFQGTECRAEDFKVVSVGSLDSLSVLSLSRGSVRADILFLSFGLFPSEVSTANHLPPSRLLSLHP